MKALVIGSQNPWLELMLLRLGADHVTTVDYQEITCEHPNITIITQYDLNKLYVEGKAPSFDIMVSYSSLEHSGLGR